MATAYYYVSHTILYIMLSIRLGIVVILFTILSYYNGGTPLTPLFSNLFQKLGVRAAPRTPPVLGASR